MSANKSNKTVGIKVNIGDEESKLNLVTILHLLRIDYYRSSADGYNLKINSLDSIIKLSVDRNLPIIMEECGTFLYKPFKSTIPELPKNVLDAVRNWKLDIWKRVFNKAGKDIIDEEALGKSLHLDLKFRSKMWSKNIYVLTEYGPRIEYYNKVMNYWNTGWMRKRICDKYMSEPYTSAIERVDRYINSYITADTLDLFTEDIDKWINNPTIKYYWL